MLTLAGLLAGTSDASAATVSGRHVKDIDDHPYTLIVFRDRRGERNDVTVTYAHRRLTFVDRRAVLHAKAPCTRITRHRVVCHTGPQTLAKHPHVLLGPGDDRVVLTSTYSQFLIDSAEYGVDGGSGDDIIDSRSVPRSSKLVDMFENDSSGGPGHDIFFGGPATEWVSGGDGADRIRGGGGHDIMSGDAGADLVDGGAGSDIVSGNDGRDRVLGGRGPDWLDGGGGTDALDGGSGNDLLDPGDGPDIAAGGSGIDALWYWYSTYEDDLGIGARPRVEPMPEMSVTFDGVGNDGPPGEGDDARPDIERAISQTFGLPPSEPSGPDDEWTVFREQGRPMPEVAMLILNPVGAAAGATAEFSQGGFSIDPDGSSAAQTVVRLPASTGSCAATQGVTGHAAYGFFSKLLTRVRIHRHRNGSAAAAQADGGRAPLQVAGANSRATPTEDAEFLVEEVCEGTRTSVTSGTVNVFDVHTRQTVVLGPGQGYLAASG